ncbi:MAG: adenylate/guanylate cyclase domain-containing protein [bacterium]
MEMKRLPPWLLKMTERRVAVIVTLALLLPLLRPGCTAKLEDTTLTAGVALSTGVEKPSGVLIAAIDERGIDELGPLPWPRATMARAIDRLNLMNAKAIAIDSGIMRASTAAESRAQGLRDDSGSVVAGYEFYTSLSDLPRGYELMGSEARMAELTLPQSPADDSPMAAMAGIDLSTLIHPGMRVSRSGFSNIFPDADDIVRRQPLAVRMKHKIFPSFAVAAAAAAKSFTPLVAEDPAGKPDGVKLGEVMVPTSSDAAIALRFRGRPGSFPSASIADIVSGKLPAETAMGKIVLIGVTDPKEAPFFATPLGPMAAIEIQANALDTILCNGPILPLTSRYLLLLFVAAAGIIFAAIGVRAPLMRRVAYSAGAIAAIWAAAIALYIWLGILIPAVHLSIAVGALLITTIAWRAIIVELPKRSRSHAFKMRLSEGSLARAMAEIAAIDKKGRERQLTACAIDIRGFASIAQPMQADKLCSFMRAYRMLMADVLLKHDAFIDTWTGDECRAVFGAPLSAAEHELFACKAAFTAIKVMTKAREEIERRYGVAKLRLCIGIASGCAAAGELGPRGAQNYGIIGGAVDAADMLRALNRSYRTSILVSDSARIAAEGSFAFRPLDPVMLPGEEKPVIIHELIGQTGVILPQLDGYLAGREWYLRGEFEKAVHAFSRVLEAHPHDGPSQLLLSRARHLLESPPRGHWTGVWGQA